MTSVESRRIQSGGPCMGWPNKAAAGRLPDKAEGRQPARVVVEGTNCVCPEGVCRRRVRSRDSIVL